MKYCIVIILSLFLIGIVIPECGAVGDEKAVGEESASNDDIFVDEDEDLLKGSDDDGDDDNSFLSKGLDDGDDDNDGDEESPDIETAQPMERQQSKSTKNSEGLQDEYNNKNGMKEAEEKKKESAENTSATARKPSVAKAAPPQSTSPPKAPAAKIPTAKAAPVKAAPAKAPLAKAPSVKVAPKTVAPRTVAPRTVAPRTVAPAQAASAQVAPSKKPPVSKVSQAKPAPLKQAVQKAPVQKKPSAGGRNVSGVKPVPPVRKPSPTQSNTNVPRAATPPKKLLSKPAERNPSIRAPVTAKSLDPKAMTTTLSQIAQKSPDKLKSITPELENIMKTLQKTLETLNALLTNAASEDEE